MCLLSEGITALVRLVGFRSSFRDTGDYSSSTDPRGPGTTGGFSTVSAFTHQLLRPPNK